MELCVSTFGGINSLLYGTQNTIIIDFKIRGVLSLIYLTIRSLGTRRYGGSFGTYYCVDTFIEELQ